jgi:hypothetical protein
LVPAVAFAFLPPFFFEVLLMSVGKIWLRKNGEEYPAGRVVSISTADFADAGPQGGHR